MKKIIDNRDTGKTRKLLEYAKENNAVVICEDVERMRNKSIDYGILGIDFLQYQDYADFHKGMKEKVVIDDVDKFLRCIGDVIGFSVSID